jgi:hypothetical protein
MIIREMAEVFGIETRNLARQFQRHKDKFPDHYYFVLTAEEYAEQLTKNWQTAERGRTDLEQYAFTEKGALFLLRFISSDQADAASILLIDAFAAMHSQTQTDMATALHSFRETFLRQRAVRGVIERAVRNGRDYAFLRSVVRSMPQWELVQEIRDSLFFGTIPTPPKGTPMHLRQPAPKAPVVTPETDPRQLSLLEG